MAARTSVGLRDVAELSGVSVTTAGRVMRNADFVRPEVREAVFSAAAKLGYVTNSVAGSLKSRKSQLIAIIVPTVHGSVFSETISAAARALHGTDLQLIVGESSYETDLEEVSIRKLIRWRPDGIILVGTNHSAASRQIISSSGIPVVEIWDSSERPIQALVGFDNAAAAQDLAERLIDKGYRSFGLVSGPMKPGNRAANRARGFRAALAGAGLREDWAIEVPYESFLGDLRQANRVALGEVLARPRVDCVFATNERSAISMIATAPQFGISIPDDLAVAGFGDIEAAALIAPGLTTVRIKGDQMGYRAIELLLAHLQKGTDIAAHVEDVGYEIVWRGSA